MLPEAHYIVPTYSTLILEAEYLVWIEIFRWLAISQASPETGSGRNGKPLIMPGKEIPKYLVRLFPVACSSQAKLP